MPCLPLSLGHVGTDQGPHHPGLGEFQKDSVTFHTSSWCKQESHLAGSHPADKAPQSPVSIYLLGHRVAPVTQGQTRLATQSPPR